MTLGRWLNNFKQSRRAVAKYCGRHTYGDPHIGIPPVGSNMPVGKLVIGSFCSIGPNVEIMLGGEHRTDWITTYPFPQLWDCASHIPDYTRTKGDVVIGSDVWIGSGALILSGVTIGHGVVIGARSVIASDVPPYAIVAGNPARLIRYRFTPEQIKTLLYDPWWEYPDERIACIVDSLCKPPRTDGTMQDLPPSVGSESCWSVLWSGAVLVVTTLAFVAWGLLRRKGGNNVA